MSKPNASITMTSSELKASAFIKQSYKRGIAIIGTSGLVFGLGVASSTPAFAAAPFECVNDGGITDNTAEPGLNPTASRANIVAVLVEFDNVCLKGDFVISEAITFGTDVHVYGDGPSSSISFEEPVGPYTGGAFLSSIDVDSNFLHDITIENLEIKDFDEVAVSGAVVAVKDSKFSDNLSGAVRSGAQAIVVNSIFEGNAGGAINVEAEAFSELSLITDSTFTNNSVGVVCEEESPCPDPAGGAAILAYGVLITNSTFVENSALGSDSFGGAVVAYGVIVNNSTFLGNSADVENGGAGGAIYAVGGAISFSTFVDNLASAPASDEADNPGNAIYRFNAGFEVPFEIGGNIFGGTSSNPHLGSGGAGDSNGPFSDTGGNVFSTTEVVESDIDKSDSSVFGASLSSIFGTSNPTLATFAPDSNGTQTFSINPSGPAVDVVPSEAYETISDYYALGFPEEDGYTGEFRISVDVDQRGALRSNLADAGAFEFGSLARTGGGTSLLLPLASATLIAVGGFVAAIASRLRRRTS
jgi:hypothetical protein